LKLYKDEQFLMEIGMI